jgi:hypothetical protein
VKIKPIDNITQILGSGKGEILTTLPPLTIGIVILLIGVMMPGAVINPG